MTPKSKMSKTFRNAVLALAQDHAFGDYLVLAPMIIFPCFLMIVSMDLQSHGQEPHVLMHLSMTGFYWITSVVSSHCWQSTLKASFQ